MIASFREGLSTGPDPHAGTAPRTAGTIINTGKLPVILLLVFEIEYVIIFVHEKTIIHSLRIGNK